MSFMQGRGNSCTDKLQIVKTIDFLEKIKILKNYLNICLHK